MTTEILIVDNDETVRSPMLEFLEMSGYGTSTAGSAEEALELLQEHPVDVVITEISLPGIDGLEFTDIVRKNHEADVVVITDYSSDYSYEEAISKGASDFVFKPVQFEELLLRLKRVVRERTLTIEREQMLERLKKLSITDGLTKLFNSRHFYSQLKSEIDRSTRYKHPLSLLIIDIDHFKVYNDHFGHIEGDKVLARLGKVIKLLLRKMDSAYRYGGEEFTVILPETEGEEAETVAQRIRKSIKAIVFFPEPGREASITISIGMTQYKPKEEITVFVQRADKALYGSKEGGRDRVSSLFA
jgi:diguanylate cyclase (GGDEF)-like protein